MTHTSHFRATIYVRRYRLLSPEEIHALGIVPSDNQNDLLVTTGYVVQAAMDASRNEWTSRTGSSSCPMSVAYSVGNAIERAV
jgi:hypothetical protein